MPAYILLVHRLRKGERGGAVRTAIWWAAALAISGTACLALWPAPTDTLVLNGPEYQKEMLDWIATGKGTEGSLSLSFTRQLLQIGIFVVLSLATAGSLSVVMGAVLLNDVSFYVAGLANGGTPAWAVVLLGWTPWTIARMTALCILGVVLAEPLVFRLFPTARMEAQGHRPNALLHGRHLGHRHGLDSAGLPRPSLERLAPRAPTLSRRRSIDSFPIFAQGRLVRSCPVAVRP